MHKHFVWNNFWTNIVKHKCQFSHLINHINQRKKYIHRSKDWDLFSYLYSSFLYIKFFVSKESTNKWSKAPNFVKELASSTNSNYFLDFLFPITCQSKVILILNLWRKRSNWLYVFMYFSICIAFYEAIAHKLFCAISLITKIVKSIVQYH